MIVNNSAGIHHADQGDVFIADDPWWKSAVVYQIYPRSFADSDGDGVGDLPRHHRQPRLPRRPRRRRRLALAGLPVAARRQRLRHQRLPGHRPEFGTLADLDELLAAMHAARHEARSWTSWSTTPPTSTPGSSSPAVRLDNPQRATGTSGASHARDGRGPGAEPNNWGSFFSGSAWEWSTRPRGQYYLHLFSTKQPDLNWDNPRVRQAVYAMMRWWLDRGVDGFRMDVINFISKDPALPDGTRHQATGYGDGSRYFSTARACTSTSPR